MKVQGLLKVTLNSTVSCLPVVKLKLQGRPLGGSPPEGKAVEVLVVISINVPETDRLAVVEDKVKVWVTLGFDVVGFAVQPQMAIKKTKPINFVMLKYPINKICTYCNGLCWMRKQFASKPNHCLLNRIRS